MEHISIQLSIEPKQKPRLRLPSSTLILTPERDPYGTIHIDTDSTLDNFLSIVFLDSSTFYLKLGTYQHIGTRYIIHPNRYNANTDPSSDLEHKIMNLVSACFVGVLCLFVLRSSGLVNMTSQCFFSSFHY